jgi:hypothetical protein
MIAQHTRRFSNVEKELASPEDSSWFNLVGETEQVLTAMEFEYSQCTRGGFVLLCQKGAGKSTAMKELAPTYKIWEDEFIMKQIEPLDDSEGVDPLVLSKWMERTHQKAAKVIARMVCSGGLVLCSLSNYRNMSLRFPILLSLPMRVLIPGTIYKHPGQTVQSFNDKKSRDGSLIRHFSGTLGVKAIKGGTVRSIISTNFPRSGSKSMLSIADEFTEDPRYVMLREGLLPGSVSRVELSTRCSSERIRNSCIVVVAFYMGDAFVVNHAVRGWELPSGRPVKGSSTVLEAAEELVKTTSGTEITIDVRHALSALTRSSVTHKAHRVVVVFAETIHYPPSGLTGKKSFTHLANIGGFSGSVLSLVAKLSEREADVSNSWLVSLEVEMQDVEEMFGAGGPMDEGGYDDESSEEEEEFVGAKQAWSDDGGHYMAKGNARIASLVKRLEALVVENSELKQSLTRATIPVVESDETKRRLGAIDEVDRKLEELISAQASVEEYHEVGLKLASKEVELREEQRRIVQLEDKLRDQDKQMRAMRENFESRYESLSVSLRAETERRIKLESDLSVVTCELRRSEEHKLALETRIASMEERDKQVRRHMKVSTASGNDGAGTTKLIYLVKALTNGYIDPAGISLSLTPTSDFSLHPLSYLGKLVRYSKLPAQPPFRSMLIEKVKAGYRLTGYFESEVGNFSTLVVKVRRPVSGTLMRNLSGEVSVRRAYEHELSEHPVGRLDPYDIRGVLDCFCPDFRRYLSTLVPIKGKVLTIDFTTSRAPQEPLKLLATSQYSLWSLPIHSCSNIPHTKLPISDSGSVIVLTREPGGRDGEVFKGSRPLVSTPALIDAVTVPAYFKMYKDAPLPLPDACTLVMLDPDALESWY